MNAKKYRIEFKPHEADMFGRIRIFKLNTLVGEFSNAREDAEELALDLGADLVEKIKPPETPGPEGR